MVFSTMLIRQIETDYQLDDVLIPWLQRSTFFCELSRHVRKFPTDSFPTAGVAYDHELDDIVMAYNPTWMAKNTAWQSEGLLTHEFYHILFGHLHARIDNMPLPKLKNVATDLAINSIIMHNADAHKPRTVQRNDFPLPHGGLIPGRWPTKVDGREPSAEEKEGARLSAIIATLKPMLASEEYYRAILEEAKKAPKKPKQNGKKPKGKDKGGEDPCDQDGSGAPGEGEPGKNGQPGEDGEPGGPGDQPGDKPGSGGGGIGEDLSDLLDEGQTLDNHDIWSTVPDDKRDYIEGKVRSMVAKAVEAADGDPNGWGNMPSEIRDAIRRSVSNIIDWRTVLRQFIGSLNPGGRSTSIRRMNRKYPRIHPGLKRGRIAKILIAIDQSGSVSDEMVAMFFAELVTLTRQMEVDIVHFDSKCGTPYTWKRGTVPALQRTKCGGTDFNAATILANRSENRGRWDGIMYMTDGQWDSKPPVPTRVKRGWILGKGCKLSFPTSEIQVCMDDPSRLVGAWR